MATYGNGKWQELREQTLLKEGIPSYGMCDGGK